MTGMPSVYLAGPDVFRPDAAAIGAAKRDVCARLGLDGRFPLDAPLPDDLASRPPAEQAVAIRAACLAMMDECDGALADLTPFRGVSADVGTAFEVGYLSARGVPVVGYTSVGDDYATRVRRAGRVDGVEVEEFGLADNLMVGAGIDVVVGGPGDGPGSAFMEAAVRLADRLGVVTPARRRARRGGRGSEDPA